MSKHEDIVIKILSDMAGIGGVPTNEEFYTEFNGRLKEELGISDSRQLSAVPSEPHIIGRIGDEDCDITPMLISALTNVCQVFDGWHQDGTVWSKFDEECRQEISKILKICDRRSVR